MRKHILIGVLSILSLSSCVMPLEKTGVMQWDLSALKLPQMEYNGKTYYIHPDAGEMTYQEALSFCERLTAYNHSDWFLPDRQELVQMISESSRIGGFTKGGYWFENPYTNYDDERYLSFQGGRLTTSGKGRVRPVRCENSFVPTVTLKQVNDGNWSTFEVSVTQSSRYTIKKTGLCWSNKANSSNRITVAESNKKDGTFQVSIGAALTRLKTMYLSAFSELSDGTIVYSNEISLLPHKPIVDFSLLRKDDATIRAIVEIKDWGFPELFDYIDVRLTDNQNELSTAKKLDIKESVYHYEEEWSMMSGTLYLVFNPFSQSDTNVHAVFSATIDKEMKAPKIKMLPVTNKTAVGLDDNTNIIYSMTLGCELVDKGYPEANSCGVIVSCTSSGVSIDDYDYKFTNRDIYQYYLENNKKYNFDNVNVTPNGQVFVRAFAESDGGVGYSDLMTINFEEPIFSNVSVTAITSSSAKVSSTITNAGDPKYTERGLVYLRSSLITNNDVYSLYSVYKHKSTIPNNNVTGTWSEDVTGLFGGTEYAIFSYIIEGGVVWFSDVQYFTTQQYEGN